MEWEWVSVDDRLPQKNGKYNCLCQDIEEWEETLEFRDGKWIQPRMVLGWVKAWKPVYARWQATYFGDSLSCSGSS